MSGRVQYYGGQQTQHLPGADNYNGNYNVQNRPHHQAYVDNKGNRNSYTEQRSYGELQCQHQNQYNERDQGYQQQNYSQPPPQSVDYNTPNYPQHNDTSGYYDQNDRSESNFSHHMEGREYYGGNRTAYSNNAPTHQNYDQRNQYSDSHLPPQQLNKENHSEEYNMQQNFESMSVNEPNYRQGNNYNSEYQNDSQRNYNSQSHHQSGYSHHHDQYQEAQHQNSRPTYNEPRLERNRFESRENPPLTYSEPISYKEATVAASQIGKPQVIAKATNDRNGGVAVFGVVAKVDNPPIQSSPPSTLLPPSNYPGYIRPGDNRPQATHSSPTRTHPLTPIMEQSGQSFQHQGADYQHRPEQEYFDKSGQERFYSSQMNARTDPGEYYPRQHPPTAGGETYRDTYRDTDSSGYGSTYTDRSYEPGRDSNVYQQEERRPPDGPRLPPNEQNSSWDRRYEQPDFQSQYHQQNVRNDWSSQEQHYNARMNNGRRDESPSKSLSSHWTLQKDSHPHSYGHGRHNNERKNEEDSGVDNSQIKGVKAVKNIFERPGANIPMPKVSSSWGSNHYSNAAPTSTCSEQLLERNVPSQNYSSYQQPPSQNHPYQQPPSRNHPSYQQPSSENYPSHQQPHFQDHPYQHLPPQNHPSYQQSPSQNHPSYQKSSENHPSYQQPPSQNHPSYQQPLSQNHPYQQPSSYNHPSYQLPPEDGSIQPPRSYSHPDKPRGPRMEDPQPPQQPSRYQDLSDNNRYRNQSPPTHHLPQQRYNEQHYHPLPNRGLPHTEPPPQHSQSLMNLDVLEPRVKAPQLFDPRTRNSYTEKPTNPPMVVGVKFQKEESRHNPPVHKPPVQQPPVKNEFIGPSYQQSYSGVQYGGYDGRRYVKSNPSSSNHSKQDYDDDRRRPERPQQSYSKQPATQPCRQDHRIDQIDQNGRPERPSSDEANYLPSVVAQSYAKFSVEQPSNQAPVDYQQTTTSSKPFSHQQHKPPSSNQYRPHEPVKNQKTQNRNEKLQPLHKHQQTGYNPPRSHGPNYSKDPVTEPHKFQENNEEQSEDDWPEPPSEINQPLQQVETYQQHVNPPQDEQRREPPTGRDSNMGLPKVPRHPFDPIDEDDSSEGVDVDAPTPPPTNRSHNSSQQRRPGPDYVPQQGQDIIWGPGYQSRSAPAGERHQKDDRYERQPGDGLNDDRYNPSISAQPSSSGHSQLRNDPKRNSSRNKFAPRQEAPKSALSHNWNDNNSQPLNHDHSKDRFHIAKTGGMSTRKPPTRMESSESLVEDYAINVTPDDLVHTRSSPISVQETMTVKQADHSKSSSRIQDKNPHHQLSSERDKHDVKQGSRLAFKVSSENAAKRNNAVAQSNIPEPISNERKKPTDNDMLDKFKSAQENAIRSAQKKQDRAFKSVQANNRMANRPRSPERSDIRVDKHVNVIKESAKRNDNRDIYNRSKPKSQHRRESPDEGRSSTHDHAERTDGRRGKEEDIRPDRGRSRARSRDRDVILDHHARSTSRERNTSPKRRGRSRSRDRHTSPDRRECDLSRDRDLDRENRTRKSERERGHHVANGSKHEERPRHRGDLKHNDEPKWVGEYRKKRAKDEPQSRSREWINDPKWQSKRKEFDMDEYENQVKKATSYNSDFEQPERKQLFPAKLMAKAPPPNRQSGDNEWMKNLKEKNKKANRNRFGNLGYN